MQDEVFVAVKIQVKVLWVATACNVATGCQYFGGPCCLHLQSEEQQSSKMSVSYHNTTQRHNPDDLNMNYVLLPMGLSPKQK
jgi:hypothetical protein